MDEPKARLQFGLRTLLVSLTTFAVLTVVLTKLFFTNFELLVLVVAVLTIFVPFFVAIGALIYLGSREKRPRLLWLGRLLIALPTLGCIAIAVLNGLGGPGNSGVGLLSSARIIQDRLPNQVDSPSVWRELEKRATSGTLQSADADNAVKVLIAHLKSQGKSGSQQPLHWQDGFLRAATNAKLVSQEVLLDMCDAYFGSEPSVTPISSTSPNSRLSLRFGTPWDSDTHHGLGLVKLWNVNRVLVDGEEIEFTQSHRSSQNWYGTPKSALPEDAKEVTFEIETAYVDADLLVGLNQDRLTPDRWPQAEKRWTNRTTVEIDAAPDKLREFRLVTDPQRKPTSILTVDRLVVQQGEDGSKIIVAQLALADRFPIAFSFDVLLEFEDTEHAIGSVWGAPFNKNGRTYSGDLLTSQGQDVDRQTRAADLILRPNVQHIRQALEQHSEPATKNVKEIWGGEIRISNVQFERLDLETSP